MVTIKIVSNPYKKIVEFYTLNNATDEWIKVDNTNNPGSKLISEEIKTGFFPYKIKEIIDIMEKEYGVPNEALNIIFEGSGDEFEEIEEVCKGINTVALIKSEYELENARSILPKIIKIFGDIKPIIDTNINNRDRRDNIDNDIAKLIDASNDIIPICVLGNYSSGKSTFINALMGVEILPSGDMPVTAKIYKIKQLNDENVAFINFEFNNEPICINITKDSYHVISNTEFEIVSEIRVTLDEKSEEALAARVNACLDTINKTHNGVSDLIDIQIPFAKSPLSESRKSFVIFDTPGSNAATHKDHFSILEDAMKNLSNGIPIYVAEYHTLDSCDNEALYEKIKSISQIDDRFTMIVVNKADKANIEVDSFDERMENDILKQAVPKNLYSGGIYFVSSFMGMGAKTDGKFINKYSAREYAKNHIDYEDETSEWYQQLYRYDIMPEQIKRRNIQLSSEHENRILANSGLLAVENEIINFAEKYSAYDKCKQSDKYIGFIVNATQEEIDEAQSYNEQLQEKLENELEEDKLELTRSVEEKSLSMSNEFRCNYDRHMSECYETAFFQIKESDIKDIEKEILLVEQDAVDYSLKQDKFKDSFNSIFNNVADGVRNKNIKDIVKTIGVDVKETVDDVQIWNKSRIEADKATADELIRFVSEHFNCKGDIATKNMDSCSRKYWEDNAGRIKEALSIIVTNSPTLDDDKKKELAEIIINYESICFGDEHVFRKTAFEKTWRLFGHSIELNKINTKKLTERYNQDYHDKLEEIKRAIKERHEDSFEDWRKKLESIITVNIVDYSPALSKQAKEIEKQRMIIEGLKATRKTLEKYSEDIQMLMDWKRV